MDNGFWTIFAAVATAVAALATGVSAVIIAFQTRATARAATATAESARETGRAADATEATVLAATKSLELAQVQQRQTLYMVTESVKSRIDASMPRFRVLIDEDLEWPPLVPAQFIDSDPVPLPANHEFIMPRDKDHRVLVRLDITVINDGPAAAHFRFNELLTNGADELRGTVLLSGDTLSGYLYHVEHTVQEWIELHNQRGSGTLLAHEFTVTSVSPMDTGALDTARVDCFGSIVEPVPSLDGHWRLVDPKAEGGLRTGSRPIDRKYYLSLRENKLLPDYGWESLSLDEPGTHSKATVTQGRL